MSNVFKSDKCTWRDEDDPCDLRKRFRIRYEQQLIGHTRSGMTERRDSEAESDTHNKDRHQCEHNVSSNGFAFDAKQGHKCNSSKNKERFSEIDIITENGVHISESERIAD